MFLFISNAFGDVVAHALIPLARSPTSPNKNETMLKRASQEAHASQRPLAFFARLPARATCDTRESQRWRARQMSVIQNERRRRTAAAPFEKRQKLPTSDTSDVEAMSDVGSF